MCYALRKSMETCMSTTTIRIPDELKARVARAAARAGTTAHNFMIEAIAEKAEADDRRSEFHALADTRLTAFLESGESIPWSEARKYLDALAVGKPGKRPVARTLKR